MKQQLVNLLPPATVAVLVLFWSLAPDSWTLHPLGLLVVSLLTLASIQIQEFIFERHEGWRINPVEFATDLFYLVLSYTVIAWGAARIADEPLYAL